LPFSGCGQRNTFAQWNEDYAAEVRTSAVALAATFLAIGVPLPATADQAGYHDRYDDLVSRDLVTCVDCDPPTAVEPPYSPFLLRLDIKRFGVDYRRSELRLTITARAYEVNHLPEVVDMRWRLKGADGRTWYVSVTDPFGGPVTATLSTNRELQPCEGLVGTIVPATSEWKVVIPASCLGAPRWVRAGGQLTHVDHLTFRRLVDDALTSEVADTTLRPRLSRKVRRG
jgi:hypothetical protein